ncbi:chromosomal replication initiator protein DnaA [bacterium]|nr:chromosomal replication initiator protein DnaA [bacterium]
MPAQVLDESKLWANLQNLLPTHLFESWLKGVRIRKIAGPDAEERYVLEVPNAIYRKRLAEYMPKISDAIRQISGGNATLDIRVTKMPAEQDKPDERPGAAEHQTENLEFGFSTSNLDPKYTFERFVVGSSNRFAHAAAVAVAESPGVIYNPLFLYGGVGLGKTHLMHAIGHFIKRKSPQAVVMYLSSEQFTNEFISAIRNRSTAAFRYKHRNVDILLLDDVQFFSHKEETQVELFHTFNELHSARKHIVLSSDRPPKDIQAIEERLRNRFEWGLTVDIQPPDYETRIAILEEKAQREKLNVRRDIIEFIAENVRTNIRELEGCLIRVSAYSSIMKQEMTLDLAREFLRDAVTRRRSILTPDGITERVAGYFKIPVVDIKSKRRTQDIAAPRMIAMYLIRKFTDHSLESIGNSFGGRDHTTVMHAIEKIEHESRQNPSTMKTLDDLMKELGVV